jgi:D-alanyl-lipoteichoic acid acyltransferase DltB (MBOAT superfamily)
LSLSRRARRRHLSLSTWLRTTSTGRWGSKGSKPQTPRNLFLVMLLGGLWHGTDWKFALWGGLVLLRILWWRRGKPEYETLASKVFGVPTTFSVVVFSCVFFRAESWGCSASPRWQLRGPAHARVQRGIAARIAGAYLTMRARPKPSVPCRPNAKPR